MKVQLNPMARYFANCKRANDTTYESLFRDGIVELRAYGRGTSPGTRQVGTPVLLVPPVAVNPELYDYHPDNSVVRIRLDQGVYVYLSSWGDTRFKDRHNTFTTYFQWVDRAVDCIKARRVVEQVFLAGYCSGGMLSAFYSALRNNVAKLVMINTPIDFAPENSAGHITNLINSWPMYLSAGRLSIVDMPRAMYRYSGRMNTRMYQLTSPLAVVRGSVKMWRELGDRAATEINVSMAEALQMKGFPGAIMQQLLHFTVNNAIVHGDVEIDGETIDLSKISVPLLCCAGDSDGMATYNAVTAITGMVGSDETEVNLSSGGHVGSVFSTGSVHQTWNKIGSWLAQGSCSSNAPSERIAA